MTNTVKNPALGWISVRHLQHMIARGEAAGAKVEDILAEAGVGPAMLADADGPVPLAVIEALLAAAARRYADPLLGLHLAGDIQPATFGAIGFICQTCATFGDALDVVARFNGLLSNIGTTTIEHGPGTVRIRWDCSAGGGAFRRHATEYVLGACVALARLMIPEKKELVLAVEFAHGLPGEAELARQYFSFFQCPVYFDKPTSAVVIPAAVLRARLHHGDAFMKAMLERHALEVLRQREQKSSAVDDVRRLIGAMLRDGVPGKDAIARQLGMSGRSLHRRLQECGSSYQAVLDDVRLEVARERLGNGGDSVAAIADGLGFASHQAFMRWFKRAVGTTPGEYRRNQPSIG